MKKTCKILICIALVIFILIFPYLLNGFNYLIDLLNIKFHFNVFDLDTDYIGYALDSFSLIIGSLIAYYVYKIEKKTSEDQLNNGKLAKEISAMRLYNMLKQLTDVTKNILTRTATNSNFYIDDEFEKYTLSLKDILTKDERDKIIYFLSILKGIKEKHPDLNEEYYSEVDEITKSILEKDYSGCWGPKDEWNNILNKLKNYNNNNNQE